jgi:hypothetical protein
MQKMKFRSPTPRHVKRDLSNASISTSYQITHRKSSYRRRLSFSREAPTLEGRSVHQLGHEIEHMLKQTTPQLHNIINPKTITIYRHPKRHHFNVPISWNLNSHYFFSSLTMVDMLTYDRFTYPSHKTNSESADPSIIMPNENNNIFLCGLSNKTLVIHSPKFFVLSDIIKQIEKKSGRHETEFFILIEGKILCDLNCYKIRNNTSLKIIFRTN